MKSILLSVVVLLTSSLLLATVWHVNNVTIPSGAPSILRDFTDLQTANDSPLVANEDTLYIYAGSYGGVTITKRLTIIGTGYFLDQNPETQFNLTPTNVDAVTFNDGSEFSVITGISTGTITVQADDITIKRCKIEGTSYGESRLHILSSYRTIVLQNYLHTWQQTYYWPSPRCILIDGEYIDPITGIQIKNNIVYHDNAHDVIFSNAACLIENNVIHGSIDVIGANYNNNIQLNGGFNGHETTIFMNNLGNTTQYAPHNVNGNKCDIDMGQVFLEGGTTDGHYQLRAGSIAIGAGLNGVDCGAFGGGTPYVLSGMPSEIPSVFFFESNYVGYSYPFHIKAKSHR